MVTSMCRTPRKPRRHPWPRAAELSALPPVEPGVEEEDPEVGLPGGGEEEEHEVGLPGGGEEEEHEE